MNQVTDARSPEVETPLGMNTLSVLAKKINTGKGERRNKSKTQENKKETAPYGTVSFL